MSPGPATSPTSEPMRAGAISRACSTSPADGSSAGTSTRYADRTRFKSPRDGSRVPRQRAWRHIPLGLRLAIFKRALPRSLRTARHQTIGGTRGNLLRQRGSGIVLVEPQTRAGPSLQLRDARTSESGHRQVDQSLQHQSTALEPWQCAPSSGSSPTTSNRCELLHNQLSGFRGKPTPAVLPAGAHAHLPPSDSLPCCRRLTGRRNERIPHRTGPPLDRNVP
jgi:hypothetical protein